MQLFETWQGSLPVILFALVITGGAVTAFARLTDRNTPVDTGLLHGRAGVAGILLLAVLLLMDEAAGPVVKYAAGLFVLTVATGVALYFIIRRKGILPKSVILIHAVFAVTGMAALLYPFIQ